MQSDDVHQGSEPVSISILLCCHNSSSRLFNTLKHLSQLQLSDGIELEVVIVDNASTDNTATRAKEIWGEVGGLFPLRVVLEPNLGLAEARRTGLLATDSELVIFCDDDNWLSREYVIGAVRIIAQDSSIGGLGGYSYAVFDQNTEPPDWFKISERDFAVGAQTEGLSNVDFLWGAGLVVRAHPLRAIYRRGVVPRLRGRSGSVSLAGDDTELCKWLLLMGYTLRYDPVLRIEHFIPLGRLSVDYHKAIREGFKNAHPIASAYQAFIERPSLWRQLTSFDLACLPKLIRNELKILVRGHLVRDIVNEIRLLRNEYTDEFKLKKV